MLPFAAFFWSAWLLGLAPRANHAGPPTSPFADARAELASVTLRASVAEPGRAVGHLSYVCDLRIDGELYPVLDLGEYVYGRPIRMGISWIVVLSPELESVAKIQYSAGGRPLTCRGNRLRVLEDVDAPFKGHGNEIAFSNRGRSFSLEETAEEPPLLSNNEPRGKTSFTILSKLRERRAALLRLLERELPPTTKVSHASHVCNLRIAGETFPVVDVHATAPGAARSTGAFLVFSPRLRLLHRIAYERARPMYCFENRLFLQQALESTPAAGNQLVFSTGGERFALTQVDARDEPAVALARVQ